MKNQGPVYENQTPNMKIQKSRRFAVDGMINDKKSLKMMEILASRLFQLANTYILEANHLEQDKY